MKIGKRSGVGAAQGHSIAGQASDVELFGAIRDELDAMKPATIATADSAATVVADATDEASAVALANDLKAKYNAAVTLINELKAALVAVTAVTGKFEK